MPELFPDELSIATTGADPGGRKAAAHEAHGAQTFAVTSAPAATPIADMVEAMLSGGKFRWKSLSSPCAPLNSPEVALIRSPSVDARSIVSASGEPRQKFRRRKVSTHLHLLSFATNRGTRIPNNWIPDEKWLLQCRGRSASTPLYDPENSCRGLSLRVPAALR
jgi:hypothetical protein